MPEELSCDGGKNLTSYEVREFLKTWGVELRISSAQYPQSNGRGECVVKAAKNLVTGNCSSNGAVVALGGLANFMYLGFLVPQMTIQIWYLKFFVPQMIVQIWHLKFFVH